MNAERETERASRELIAMRDGKYRGQRMGRNPFLGKKAELFE